MSTAITRPKGQLGALLLARSTPSSNGPAKAQPNPRWRDDLVAPRGSSNHERAARSLIGAGAGASAGARTSASGTGDAIPAGDPLPITTAAAIRLTTGLTNGIRARVPASHLGWLKSIRALREPMVRATDAELRTRFLGMKERLDKGASLDSLLPEVFAIVREVSRRKLKMEHYEVQLLAGMALFDGAIAELKTGEGKTIAAALAASLIALEGKGCHVVTTNSYLARRDAELLRPLYEALGLSVGFTASLDQFDDDKRAAYRADITYGEAETFAFDWLNDQLVLDAGARVQRPLAAAIVDEADDVLIDAAQMPLILSGPSSADESFEKKKELIALADEIAKGLDPKTHLLIDYEDGSYEPSLSEAGLDHVERVVAEKLGHDPASWSLWRDGEPALLGRLLQAIHARYGVDAGKEYIGKEDRGVVLVSDATGHPQPKSRWRDGLMEAVQQKEGAALEPDQRMLGEITYQNFFLMYRRMSGMTGTARDALEEVADIYGKKVIQIPTHEPVRRVDAPDRFFPHPALQRLAAAADVVRSSESGQPVLVSTTTVGESKRFSRRLADPLLLFAEAVLSSDALFRAAAELVDGGEELIRRAGVAPTADRTRAALTGALRERLAADLPGAEKIAAFLAARGLDARVLLGHGAGIEHEVLNAETLAKEAEIIARAGQKGAITVATQVAGRGIDIPLGEGVAGAGGLRVVGVGHQTNSRKDEQVMGRSGRQGKPGSTQFYVSLADPLFSFLPASDVRALAKKLNTDQLAPDGGPLRGAWESAVRRAQERSEAIGREARKKHKEFDGVVQRQRRAIREAREEILRDPEPRALLRSWIHEAGSSEIDDQRLDALEMKALALIEADGGGPADLDGYCRRVVLRAINLAWVAYQEEVNDIRTAAQMRTMAQKDPIVEFINDSSDVFLTLFSTLKLEIAKAYAAALEAA